MSRTLTTTLVDEIRKLGIPAEPARMASPVAGPTLSIEGQIVSINEGNKAKRLVIGLGSGASEVRMLTQVYAVTSGDGHRLIEDFSTTTKSSRKPGFGPMAGMGAAAGLAASHAAAAGGIGMATALSQTETMSAGVGLGVTWGDGVLEYHGEKYPFTVTSFDVGDLGVAKVIANGIVFNLKSVEDFSGMFAAVVAGGTFGGGAGSGAMYNNNKVSMVWTGTNQGLNITLAHSGVNVELTQEAKLQAAKVRRNVSAEEHQPAAAPRATP